MSEPVVTNVRVACPLHDAFTTFTARIDLWWPAAHRAFRGSVMVLEPWVGGRFFEKAQDGREARLGEVLRFDPPTALAYSWYPAAIDKPTIVEVSFVEEQRGVLVTVKHSEGESALGEEWPRRARRFALSWSEVLPGFAAFIASEESITEEDA
jgi:uncharacterized protein YndB with AHSA1/START domain